MGAPPALSILPVSSTDVLVIVPLCTVNIGSNTGGGVGVGVGVAGGMGASIMLAGVPAPAEFIALTLNVCVVFDRPINVWLVLLCAVIHGPPLRDTWYPVIGAPPVLAGGVQFKITCPVPGMGHRFWGAVGVVITISDCVLNVCALPCHALGLPWVYTTARTWYIESGVRPVIVAVNMTDPTPGTILCWVTSSLRIQNPREVIGKPPGLDIMPMTDTLLLVIVPSVVVNVGSLKDMIE